ncbi:MAG: 6,7-dimethyl-8-ribityllumazine synthase [Actinobacteria bacterium]|nr:6,7-dimethyl-8-ribityllumazine synthase [Actinomycetota bacterium]MCL6105683.1 6,7-dimethyl-8-ribityllumazine synthase [Actinomycetota bacterium]
MAGISPKDFPQLGDGDLIGSLEGEAYKIAIVCSKFNLKVTERLLFGARRGLEYCHVKSGSVQVVWVPGSFELPLAAAALASGIGGSKDMSTKGFDAIICLGAVIRGDTDHHLYVGHQAAAGIQRVQLDTKVPVIFGVLTVDTLAQAMQRSGEGRDNKGFEAACTAVEMADLLHQISAI